jgi:hypothetical protein
VPYRSLLGRTGSLHCLAEPADRPISGKEVLRSLSNRCMINNVAFSRKYGRLDFWMIRIFLD